MRHADQRWTDALPIVLLGIRTAFKDDLQASVADLVYGEPLRVPGELLNPTTCTVEPSHLINQLRRHMQRLSLVTAARHASPATFVHKDLQDSTHVFLRQDATRRALDPPYSGPHKVISRREKTLQLSMRGKSVSVSADRVKPAYMLNETGHGTDTTETPPRPVPQAAASPDTRTTRSRRHVRFTARYNTWANISAGGWCGSFPTSQNSIPQHQPISTVTINNNQTCIIIIISDVSYYSLSVYSLFYVDSEARFLWILCNSTRLLLT
jgi:hypothetical protein